MSKLTASRVLSGSFARLWIDGVQIAEADSISLNIIMERSDVQIGVDIDSKLTGYRGEGQLKLKQVYTRFTDIVKQAKQGHDARVTITTALKDPDSVGGAEERYSVSNVALEQLPLVNYSTGKINEQTIRFRFAPGDLTSLSEIVAEEQG